MIALSAIMFGCSNDEKNEVKNIDTVTSIGTKEDQTLEVNDIIKEESVSWEEGKHYSLMESHGGLEKTVLEVFWYGCPHCRKMESVIQNWKTNHMPEDYTMMVVPATPNPVWASHAALYYGLKSLGLEEQYRNDVFEMFSEQRDAEYLENWFEDRNINKEDINQALKDEDVIAEVKADSKIQAHYLEKSKGVPAIIVNGKYLINLRAFKEYENAFSLVDYLIEVDRKDI